jgi:hypothetical protein
VGTSATRTWPSPPGPKKGPGATDDPVLLQERQREGLRVAGDAQPQEEGRVAAGGLHAGGAQRGQQRVALGGVARPRLGHVLLVAPGGDRRPLHERLRRHAHVRPVALERGDDRRVARREPRAVPRHGGALGERVEHHDVGQIPDAQSGDRRLAREPQLGVGLVAGQHEVVAAGQPGGLLVELRRGGRGGRVVGEVQPQQRHAGPVDRAEVRPPAAPGLQRQLDDVGAREQRAARRDRIARRRHRHAVAPRRHDLGQVEDRLLGPQRGEHLRRRVQLHAEAPGTPAGHRGAQLRQTLRERIGRHGLGFQRLGRGQADEGRRLLARLADAEVDDVHAARGGGRPGLGEADERVRGQALEDRVQPHTSLWSVS